jgi:ketosteroid isomerase-like protein
MGLHTYRTNRCFLLALLVGALLGSAAAARPAGAQEVETHRASKHVKQQIASLEEQWRTATLTADAAKMDKLLSDDYVGISWTGQVNTKQMQMDRLTSRSLTIKSMDLSDFKVKVVGPVAIVTSRAEVTGTMDGRALDGQFRFTRVYQRVQPGTWKITNFEATRIPNGMHHGRGDHGDAAR